ncbi:hypothetical protein DFH28DRAFT_947394 [Melampsora americana]|nr:hypothetical protein DFH28DRAFT_947394 [Melampsora americana]
MRFVLFAPILSHVFFQVGEVIGSVEVRSTRHTLLRRESNNHKVEEAPVNLSLNQLIASNTTTLTDDCKKANLVTCKSAAGPNMTADTNDCQAVARYMANASVPCAMFKSCAFMTRNAALVPTALVNAPPDEAAYAFGNFLSEDCTVDCPIARQQWTSPPSPNDNLTLTYLFFNKLETAETPQKCDDDVFGALKNSPA